MKTDERGRAKNLKNVVVIYGQLFKGNNRKFENKQPLSSFLLQLKFPISNITDTSDVSQSKSIRYRTIR